MDALLGVMFRWFHVVAAAIVIGGVFMMRVVVPIGIAALDAEQGRAVFLRCRRVFKMAVHTCILLLLVTGAYNTWTNWSRYRQTLPWSHAFWGPHVIFGLLAIGISLFVLAGKEPPKSHRKWMAVNLVILLLVVLAGGATKWVRDHPDRYARQLSSAPGR